MQWNVLRPKSGQQGRLCVEQTGYTSTELELHSSLFVPSRGCTVTPSLCEGRGLGLCQFSCSLTHRCESTCCRAASFLHLLVMSAWPTCSCLPLHWFPLCLMGVGGLCSAHRIVWVGRHLQWPSRPAHLSIPEGGSHEAAWQLCGSQQWSSSEAICMFGSNQVLSLLSSQWVRPEGCFIPCSWAESCGCPAAQDKAQEENAFLLSCQEGGFLLSLLKTSF